MTKSGGKYRNGWWRAFACHNTGAWQATARPHYLCAFLLGCAALGCVALAACGQIVPAPSPTPRRSTAVPDVQVFAGSVRYAAVGCAACHGPMGEGAIGPRLSGITKPLPDVIAMMRTEIPHGITFEEDELSNQDIINIYLWLRTDPAAR